MKSIQLSALILLAAAAPVRREGNCTALVGGAVREAISAELAMGWRVVTPDDLPPDDRALWNRQHSGKCPGVSEGDFAGGGSRSYAIALLRAAAPSGYTEQLILVGSGGHHSSRLRVVAPTHVESPLVVWSRPPGRYTGWDGGPRIDVSADSFVYEKMEATATQYYFQHGQLHTLLVSN
jgi:hypothetical protein